MTLFRRTRQPSRLHRILAAAALEDAMTRAGRRGEMPPRPPQFRPAAEPPPEIWGGSVRGMQGDPCGSGPVQDISSEGGAA